MKLKRQIQICISYYSNPTKNDFKHNPKINNVDYIITSADISGKIDSHASHIPYSRYRILGIPKEDYIIKPRFTKEDMWEKLKLNDNINKLVLYCPTHRDYERKTNKKRNVFGYAGDYTSLNMLLNDRNAVLIIKLHMIQELKVITYVTDLSNVRLYEDSYDYTLCDIIPHTDLLITDYSSTAFDFMLTKKPIIYNFYDFDTYQDKRGFAYDPFELVCAGPIVKTKDDLENEIAYQLDCVDSRYKEKYKWVHRLVHKYDDGNASKRIYQFVHQLIKKKNQ
jgi:CDP-glycerol glycerophosphotransferase (TagB/SpsB family)